MSSISALNSLLSSNSSSSAIDVSSILQAALGASSPGLDVSAAVSSAISAARAPENAWEDQLSTLQSQATALQSFQSAASSLDDDVVSLNSLVGPLAARTVSSSNTSIVSASATSGTATGNHVIVVNNLATTASWTSGTFASSSTALPAGSFTITNGSGTATTINTDGSQTLSAVAAQINSDNLGVTANVINDSSGARLAIVANTSGSAANFSISSSGANYGFSQAVTGTNASLTVDGISISSATNTVTGAAPGLTLNLLSANPNTEVSLGVTPDSTQAANAINQFVTDYNSLISGLTTQFTYNGASEGVLATDSTARNLQSALLGSIDYTYTPGSGSTTMPNLSSMGISVGNDGKLTVDSATLQSALQNNYSDVQNFFQGAALNGFAHSVDQQLSGFISAGDGAFTVDLQSISKQETELTNDISNFETNYITPLKAQLTSEYSQAEILLQQLPAQMKQINAELGGNNSGN
jgi:flagellar hook-associated protein 2